MIGLWAVMRSSLLGAGGGLLSGLTGMGGGAIFVPVLYFFERLPVREAIGTSLAIIVVTSLTGLLHHHRKRRGNPRLALLLIISGLPGTQLGVFLAVRLPEAAVKSFFILLILFLALLMWRRDEGAESGGENCRRIGTAQSLAVGLAAGIVSGLGGVGGAVVLVPLLHLHTDLRLKDCIGTTFLVVFCNSLASALGYLARDLVNFRVLSLFAAGALPATLIGAHISLKLPQDKLRRLFALVLVLMAGLFFLNRGR